MDFIFTVQAQAGRYKYKFQGQERQEDLNLGWDSFKYRNYDYAIGRFFNVDPLAEKFPYMTVYQFAGNKPVWSPEIEGLESGVDVMMKVRDEEILNRDNNNNNSNSGNNNSTQNTENNSTGDSNSSTGSSNVNNTDNNIQDSHIVFSPGTTQELPVGTVTNGGVELPQNFGTWNTPGSDGRQWIGCMSCHGENGAYRTLAYESPSREIGKFTAEFFTGMMVGGVLEGFIKSSFSFTVSSNQKSLFSGERLFQSNAVGYKSPLFGRYHPKYLPDGRRGLLNRGAFRTGWSNHGNRHVFRTAFGKRGTKWKIDWFYGDK